MKKYICSVFILFLIAATHAQMNLEAVTYGPDTFVAIASNGEILRSENGIDWSSTPAPQGNWQDIIYENGRYVVVGTNSAMTSPDGENWTVHSVPNGSWTAIVSNGSLYVATATWGSNYVMTSPDGASWTIRTPAYTWSHDDVAYGSIGGTDRFVAVCQFGRGWVASDPTGTWSQINPGAIVDIRAITFGNGKFVWLQWATSGTTYAGVSTNGTNFSAYQSGVTNQWNSMAYGNNTYVAVASGGGNTRAAYSSDGQTWAYGTGVEANAWQSVAFGNGVFVAIANSGDNRVMYSYDGMQWNHDVNLPSVVQEPSITSFTPEEAATGGAISISGSHFENTTSVQFGGVEAASFSIDSDTNITAIVPAGAISGDITVTNSAGSDNLSGFTFNGAPTDISLSISSISENNGLNDVLGVLNATDPNNPETFSFELVAGVGDSDNWAFTISESNLLANTVFNFETKQEYSLRIEVQDAFGNNYQKAFSITIADVNESPTDITLDNPVILENSEIGTVGGILNTIDPDVGNVHTYTLIVGNGTNDMDNARFTIDGNQLKLAAVPDFETQPLFTIYINVNDGANDFQKSFEIAVSDENEDLDDDGVDNRYDACPNTPIGEAIDDTGCSESQRDTDGDGAYDHADADDDGDGTLDGNDAFPKDPAENTDTDGDGTGDNNDEDDDNDGTVDSEDAFPIDALEDTDTDNDGIGDRADEDADNDGTPDDEDDFPTDPSEDSDRDGDGVGDRADDDDDNDGLVDVDHDGDGIGDAGDDDDDNDGVPDNEDAFPSDPGEDTDTDGDGIGDHSDTDDDGDEYSDEMEIVQGTNPLDASSIPADFDSDGIPDSLDDDDDNDSVADHEDAFPRNDEPGLVPAQAFTPNGDGNNDAWIIPGINNYPGNKVLVYNRWGHEVFAARSYRNDWEGFQKGGSSKLPAGSYLYIIDLGDGSAPLKGWIFINY